MNTAREDSRFRLTTTSLDMMGYVLFPGCGMLFGSGSIRDAGSNPDDELHAKRAEPEGKVRSDRVGGSSTTTSRAESSL